jgi:hypothetical protein
LSYYLTGKALDFYEQVVIRKPATYTLEDFFLDLFDFCFPADFWNEMRDQLNRCYQNAKPVLEHIASFEQLWRVVGLPNDQEKVVRFWRSLRADIQQELYRKDLDAEVSQWDEVVLAAERAEVWLKLDIKSRNTTANAGASNNASGNSNPGSRKERTGFIPRGSGGRGRGTSRGGSFLRTSSVGFQAGSSHPRNKGTAGSSKQKQGKSPEEKPMSAQKRNEMLAEGRCFTCNDVGHFARNCPKTANVVSKQKGKPPGFGIHAVRFAGERDAALYESTEVLETLPVGSIGLSLGANESIDGSDQEVEYSPPPRSIGDLYAFNAELVLEMGQPYPGDAEGVEFNGTERRFCVYRTTETQYVIMDSITDDDRLIDDAHLRDPRFELGLWYARERRRAMGRDPLFVTLEERYTAELGDALIIGARTMLEHAYWDGVESSSTFSRFHIQDATEGKLTIMDFEEELQFLLPRANLVDQAFDLVGWFRSELEGCKKSDSYNLGSVSEIEAGLFGHNSSTDSDVPPLEDVSDSDVSDDDLRVRRTYDKTASATQRETPRRLGDLLEEAVRLILEVSQPYPGDEMDEDDVRLQRSRFIVSRATLALIAG